MLRDLRESQYHAIFDNRPCAIIHPSTAATVPVALGATVELVDAADGVCRGALEEFFVLPVRDLQRENDLKPHEILTIIRLPPLPAGARMAHLRQGRKGGVRLAARRRRRAARPRRRGDLPARLDHARRRRGRFGRQTRRCGTAVAARAALAGATPLAKNGGKLPLFEALVRRDVLAAASPTARD